MEQGTSLCRGALYEKKSRVGEYDAGSAQGNGFLAIPVGKMRRVYRHGRPHLFSRVAVDEIAIGVPTAVRSQTSPQVAGPERISATRVRSRGPGSLCALEQKVAVFAIPLIGANRSVNFRKRRPTCSMPRGHDVTSLLPDGCATNHRHAAAVGTLNAYAVPSRPSRAVRGEHARRQKRGACHGTSLGHPAGTLEPSRRPGFRLQPLRPDRPPRRQARQGQIQAHALMPVSRTRERQNSARNFASGPTAPQHCRGAIRNIFLMPARTGNHIFN